MGSLTRVYTQLFVTRNLFRREDGQTMAEYAVILAVISGLVILALGLLSGNIQHEIERIADAIS
jgi:Flp pilus assembly pilin Flp